MKDKEKELKYLIYLKSELIRQTKKELRQLKVELQQEQKQKKLNEKHCK